MLLFFKDTVLLRCSWHTMDCATQSEQGGVDTCETITTIKMMNKSTISESFFVFLGDSSFIPQEAPPLICLLSLWISFYIS